MIADLKQTTKSVRDRGGYTPWFKEYMLDNDKALLPVGAKFGSLLVTGRNVKEREKTKVEIAREKNRAVGKYSYERIEV